LKTKENKITAIGFFHTWNGKRTLQSPYNAIVDSIRKNGVDLKIIWTNELVPPDADIHAWDCRHSEEKVLELISEVNPDFILSINNGGLSRRIRAGIKCPVIKWLFDDFPHLFFHNGVESIKDAIVPGDIVLCYTNSLAMEVKQKFPEVASNVFFVPHATDLSLFQKLQWQPKYNISFVGSFLNIDFFIRSILSAANSNPSVANSILSVLRELRNNYDCDFEKLVNDYNLNELVKERNLDWLHFKRLMSDVITTQDRLAGLASVSDLGLSLFGGKDWFGPLAFSDKLINCFQLEAVIDTQEKLTQVYQSSRIAIDLPNIQNRNSISNRVIDVMASGSLLITKYQEKSDMFLLFGKDCPVPMYKNNNHLHELCHYYLNNESERLEIVKKCNMLVKKIHSYDEQSKYILSLVNLRSIENSESRVSFINTSKFSTGALDHRMLELIKPSACILAKNFIPRKMRERIINTLTATLT
jgi:spore maturation protein CgeB